MIAYTFRLGTTWEVNNALTRNNYKDCQPMIGYQSIPLHICTENKQVNMRDAICNMKLWQTQNFICCKSCCRGTWKEKIKCVCITRKTYTAHSLALGAIDFSFSMGRKNTMENLRPFINRKLCLPKKLLFLLLFSICCDATAFSMSQFVILCM